MIALSASASKNTIYLTHAVNSVFKRILRSQLRILVRRTLLASLAPFIIYIMDVYVIMDIQELQVIIAMSNTYLIIKPANLERQFVFIFYLTAFFLLYMKI